MGHRQRREARAARHRRAPRLRVRRAPRVQPRQGREGRRRAARPRRRSACSPPTTSRRSSPSTPTASATRRSGRRSPTPRHRSTTSAVCSPRGRTSSRARSSTCAYFRPGPASSRAQARTPRPVRGRLREGRIDLLPCRHQPGLRHGLLADHAARGCAAASTSSPSPRSSTCRGTRRSTWSATPSASACRRMQSVPVDAHNRDVYESAYYISMRMLADAIGIDLDEVTLPPRGRHHRPGVRHRRRHDRGRNRRGHEVRVRGLRRRTTRHQLRAGVASERRRRTRVADRRQPLARAHRRRSDRRFRVRAVHRDDAGRAISLSVATLCLNAMPTVVTPRPGCSTTSPSRYTAGVTSSGAFRGRVIGHARRDRRS